MPQITIQTNVPIVRKGLEKLRAALPTIGHKRLYDAALNLLSRMRVPGAASRRPVHWDSFRQLRAYYASGGFGGGIPTTRTDRYVRGWKVERANKGYTVINPTPGAKFIGGLSSGAGQSQIHVRRWRLLRDQAEIVRRSLPKLVVDNLRAFVKEAFKTTITKMKRN